MGFKILPVSEYNLDKLNSTMHKYFDFVFWSKSNIVRYLSEDPFTFLIDNKEEQFLMSSYEDNFKTSLYGIDYADRLSFYDINLWELSPILKEFKGRFELDYEESIKIPCVYSKDVKDTRLFIKNLKRNYRSHLIGKKSEQYRVENYSYVYDKLKVLDNIAYILKKYGNSRYTKLLSLGGGDLSENMHNLLFNFHTQMERESDSFSPGITFVYRKDEPIGFLTWYIKDNTMYLEEIIMEESLEVKPLSLYITIQLRLIIDMHTVVNKFMLGFPLGKTDTTIYKDLFTTDFEYMNLLKPKYKSLDELKKAINYG